MSGKIIVTVLAVIGIIAALVGQAQPSSSAGKFEAWMTKFGVKYESKFEEAYRKRVFQENLAKIEEHNNNEFRTYDMGVNQFSALTDEEFKQTYLGTVVNENNIQVEDSDDISVGDIDWTSQGVVTPIKNQGQCGSCWAFSTTGSLEALSKLAYGNLQSFSEQQLVDCSGSYGNMGCNGGLMDNAFKYVRDHGIVEESQYAYTAKKGTCKQNSGPFKISGYTDVNGCTNLANALTSRPVSVAVDASNWSRYSSGVFSNCGTHLNHGVLLVGASDQSWKIKNSWSASWGENGFIRLARGNTCGICNKPSYPNK